jgi:hypothetical protein
MSEEPSKMPHSFLKFLWISIAEGWRKSREKFGLLVDISLWLGAIAIVAFTWYSKHNSGFNEQNWESGMNYWFAIIPAGLWVIWFFYHALKASHNIYLEQYEKTEAERKLHDVEKNALVTQLQAFQSKLDEKEHKKQVKNVLADYLQKLEYRILAIRQTEAYKYVKTIASDGTEPESTKLLKEITTFLESEGLHSEALLFVSTTGLSFSKDSRTVSSVTVSEQWELKRVWTIDVLEHYAKQLKEIINAQK